MRQLARNSSRGPRRQGPTRSVESAPVTRNAAGMPRDARSQRAGRSPVVEATPASDTISAASALGRPTYCAKVLPATPVSKQGEARAHRAASQDCHSNGSLDHAPSGRKIPASKALEQSASRGPAEARATRPRRIRMRDRSHRGAGSARGGRARRAAPPQEGVGHPQRHREHRQHLPVAAGPGGSPAKSGNTIYFIQLYSTFFPGLSGR